MSGKRKVNKMDEQQMEGFDFMFSMRGQLILGQALEEAMLLMSNRQPSYLREHSNMKDMEYILEKFPTMKVLGNTGKRTMPDEERHYQIVREDGTLIHAWQYNTLNGIIAYEVAKSLNLHGIKCRAVLSHKAHGQDKPYEILVYPSDEEE